MIFSKFGLRLHTLLIFIFCCSAQAFTPTPQQIEQFKRMSPAQQQALARSVGVDINDFAGFIGKGNGRTQSNLPKETISGQRGGRESEKAEAPPPLAAPTIIAEVAPTDIPTPEKLPRFGYDMFNLGADAFTPATDIPIPANYVLGPGDTLIVQLYGKESATHSLIINRDGAIQFPEIGPINLAGLHYQRAVQKIEEVVSKQMIGIKSSITMGQLRTIRIFILGEVNVPGSYVVGSLSTMTNAIFASGGVSAIGSLRNIQLKRAGNIITTLDLYDLLLNGDSRGDNRLLPGDVIFVPTVGPTAAATGAVKRPAIYELGNTKSAAQLIALAGGLMPTAYLPASKIERISPNGEKSLVKIDLTLDKATHIPILSGDLLTIGSALDDINERVVMNGHIKRPGEYPWKPGLRFTDLIPNSGAFLDLPDLNLALVARERPNTRELKVFTFSPNLAFDAPGSTSDPILHSRDTVFLFGFDKDRSEQLNSVKNKLTLQAHHNQHQRTVSVNGSIRFPGEYPLADNMTVSQLVALAGGFTESAFDRNAEITRYEINTALERILLHIPVDFSTSDPELSPGDQLQIKQIPLWAEKETVSLSGELLHPGTYAILPGETLLDVLHRAGGLTPRAFPEGAIFSRADLRALEGERIEDLKRQVEADIAAAQLESSNTREEIDASDAEKILENIDGTRPLGRMVIDLPDIIKSPETLNFQLEDGDVLDIPRYKPSVTVVGEVQYPTSHFHSESLGVNEYIERSGGFKRNADKRRVFVIKANGQVIQPKGHNWFAGRRLKLTPGDTIVVPVDTTRVDKLTLWASVTKIMYEAALGVAAISSL